MALKTLTVFLDDGDASPARLGAAIALASAQGAHLDAVALLSEPAFTYVAGSEMAVDLWSQQLRERREAASAIAEDAAKRIAAEGVSAGARADAAVVAAIAELSALHARCSDVGIVGAPGRDGDGAMEEILDGVLFGSGRPVIVIPQGARAPDLKRIVVAWDGAQAAARAIHDAMPLLVAAERVDLALVDPRPSVSGLGEEPGADIATQMARHGVNVSVERIPSMERSTAEAIIGFASDAGAGLIVMGGYGHSKLREAVFGGVTREMLRTSPIPMLMAH